MKIEKSTKKELAKSLNISRSSLYYVKKKSIEDLEVKNQIEAVLSSHPAYGHKRIADELKLNKKRILRIMKIFNIKPYIRRPQKPNKEGDINQKPSSIKNLIKEMIINIPNSVWVGDFTYLKYKGRFIYLSTVLDLYTREIVGYHIRRFHDSKLIELALIDALQKSPYSPKIFHSDQGSEYQSESYQNLLNASLISPSMSRKGSPWENGFQESFYSQFKLELGDFNRWETYGELIENIIKQIYYYNNNRIHTSLRMPPVSFKENYQKNIKLLPEKTLNNCV